MERDILVGLVLGIQSYWDIKEKQIPMEISIVGGIMGGFLSIYQERGLWDVALAMIPGISLLIIGKLSRESIGYGDGIIISMLGMFYSLEEVGRICFCAFSCSAAMALVLIVLYKKKGKDTIAFVPFLLLGWCINMWM